MCRPSPLTASDQGEVSSFVASPTAGLYCAQMGAEVIRIDRGHQPGFSDQTKDPLLRSRRSIAIDLKTPQGIATVRRIVASADGLIEGYRPGVMERLGLGPEVLLNDNPRLVYGRMTGWGQDGMYGQAAGHDINYIALAGALAHFGRAGEMPTPPLNMVGDFGGGGMFLALGVVAALLEAQKSGKGQVVDTAMVDGTAVLMSMFYIGGELAQSRLGLPKSLTGVFQGLLLFCLLACDVLMNYRLRWRSPQREMV